MNDQIGAKEAWEQLLAYDPAVWIGILAALIVFVIEIVLGIKGVIFAGGEKKIERAKRAGKTLTATMTNCRYEDRSPHEKTANRMYIALYEYYVGDKRITKQVVSTSIQPPRTITLYYTSTPDKAFSEYEVGKNPLKVIIYIVPIIVAFLVMKALGFSG